jgi:hypothetical protein
MISIIYCCKDCGNKIGRDTALQGLGRCKSCNAKYLHLNRIIDNRGKFRKRLIYCCMDCGTLINRKTALHGFGRCYSCNGKERMKHINLTGNKNPNYKHGLAKWPYPPEFNKDLKDKIRIRDNNCCQKCNLLNLEHKNLFKYDLTIHHIDYNKFNCQESNLITLCHTCNVKANGNRDYWFAYYTYIIENF